MMAFWGNLGAGAGFLGVGLWQAYVTVKAYRLSKTSTSNRDSPASKGFAQYGLHAIVALLAVLHMIFGLISTNTQNNGAGVGAAFGLERIGVAAIFFLYAVVALISDLTTALPLPAGMVDLLAVWAFGEEFSLFYLTSEDHDNPGLETQYYSLLLVPIGVCLLATVAEIANPASILPRFVRSLALILQGTWFFQMAASLYTKAVIAHGCSLLQSSEGVYTVSCESMSLMMRGRALATLQFNCQLALLLLTLLPIYAVLTWSHPVPENYVRLSDNQVPELARELDNGGETGQELSPADHFQVIGEDDEEEEEDGELEPKEEISETNGFHRVVI